MKRIGIIVNCSKPAAPSTLRELGQTADQLGLELFTTAEAHSLLPQAETVKAEDLAGKIEVLMALGGDGTVIGAATSPGSGVW